MAGFFGEKRSVFYGTLLIWQCSGIVMAMFGNVGERFFQKGINFVLRWKYKVEQFFTTVFVGKKMRKYVKILAEEAGILMNSGRFFL